QRASPLLFDYISLRNTAVIDSSKTKMMIFLFPVNLPYRSGISTFFLLHSRFDLLYPNKATHLSWVLRLRLAVSQFPLVRSESRRMVISNEITWSKPSRAD